MEVRCKVVDVFFLAVLAVATTASTAAVGKEDSQLALQVEQFVRQLNDDRAAVREEAEQRILELAARVDVGSDRMLQLLPEPHDRMPAAVRDRLEKIRKQIEATYAKSALQATQLSLQLSGAPLEEALTVISDQTGNRLVDFRDSFGQDVAASPITVNIQDEKFWPAVDQILDQAGLGVYNFAGEDALALVARDAGAAPRFGRAVYQGPFRFEITEVQAQRSLRQPERQSLRIGLEVAWEPRLKPIALSQPPDDLEATDERGRPVAVATSRPRLDVEVAAGNQAVEFVLPLELPPRDVSRLATLAGTLQALVPARQMTFRFDKLANADGQVQSSGGVQVTLDSVRKNNEIWEVHMRLTLDEGNQALESHRGWPFQNITYMEGADGAPIDHVGFETTRQTSNEVGIAYLFDLPEGIDGLTWVYQTPAAIVQLPVEYELKDIPLP